MLGFCCPYARYTLLISLPLVSMTVDFTLALVKQGAPVDVVVFYFTSMVVLFILVHMRASINLMFFLCDCFAEPFHPSHVAEAWEVNSARGC